jgi:uncharacterized membrane protein
VSGYLATRGLWLILLELTVIRFGWTFSLRPDFVFFQVIWALGWGMIALAGLIFLPRPVLGAVAAILIGGHDLLDGVKADAFGQWKWLWLCLHQPGLFQIGSKTNVLAIYPLIPWTGVLIAGYAFGPVFISEPRRRRRDLLISGTAVILGFVLLRAANRYGDPAPWTGQPGIVATVLSFVNCEKYPPSLLFLAMTLGPALLALGALDGAKGRMSRFFITFGRVPFFYYLGHVYLIHLVAVMIALAQHGNVSWLWQGFPPLAKPPEWGLGLPMVYALWLIVVLSLFPLCRWFGDVKQRRREWWLSYL